MMPSFSMIDDSEQHPRKPWNASLGTRASGQAEPAWTPTA